MIDINKMNNQDIHELVDTNNPNRNNIINKELDKIIEINKNNYNALDFLLSLNNTHYFSILQTDINMLCENYNQSMFDYNFAKTNFKADTFLEQLK